MSANWQPIDTAPKDGTSVLVCQAVDADSQPITDDAWGLFVQRAAWWGGEWIVYCSLPDEPSVHFEPSHWMAVPPNPLDPIAVERARPGGTMGALNEFHVRNWERMHEAFAPPHGLALAVCVQEEVGELATLAAAVKTLEADLAEMNRIFLKQSDRISGLGRENTSLKTQNEALEQENAELAARNLKLEDSQADQVTLAAIRQETVRRLHERLGRLGELLREADRKASAAEARAIRAEVDLASAVRTGEEQAAWIITLQGVLADEERRSAAELIRPGMAIVTVSEATRLAKLDALLASEEAPMGLWRAMFGATNTSNADRAWRWLREQLGVSDKTTHRPASAESPQRSPAEASPRPTASE